MPAGSGTSTNRPAQEERIQTTVDILSAEFARIWNKRGAFANEQDYRQAAHAYDQAAICLSGGGIRSAAFSLGVIQALAQKGLLTRFHYLSTVSGGGYIGAWLCRWINDEKDHNASAVEKKLAASFGGPVPNVPEIQELRENSNYLTPRLGLTSADFWTAVTLSVRNIILNWLIFLPALFSVTAFFNLYFSLLQSTVHIPLPKQRSEWSRHIVAQAIASEPLNFVLVASYATIAAAALFTATFYWCRYLPSLTSAQLNTRQLIQRVILPTFVFSLILPLLLSVDLDQQFIRLAISFVILSVACLAFVSAACAVLVGSKNRAVHFLDVVAVAVDVLLWIFGSAVLVGILIACLWAAERIGNPTHRLLLIATIAPLLLTWSQTMQAAFYVGFHRRQFRADADREWLARLSAMRVLPPQIWMLFAIACLVLPYFVQTFLADGRPHWPPWAFGALSLISGLVAVIGGKNSALPADAGGTPAKRKLMLSTSAIINAATAIFVATLFMGLAWLETASANALLRSDAAGYQHALFHLAILVLAIFFVRAVGKRINVNRFSLHGLYRNRLIRAFLGGARRDRTPDLFTGFDSNDNIRMHELEAFAIDGRGKEPRLFPVVNLTMNLVRADRLAWQERKAGPFTVTPLSCGSAMLSLRREHDPAGSPDGCYVSSQIYGGAEPDLGNPGSGISLGTAMTISGAAATPSMGYHSSPGTAFLMTLFNVRLGAWLGNPASGRRDDLERSSPDDALRPLFAEMFGQTNDRGRDIYLSDGGHFENLGLYEMVRRRCRFILVVDADCDTDCHLEDLGNAIRKIYIDQNIKIVFDNMNLSSREKARELNAVAVGRIHYPDPSSEPGWLIYLKASYFAAAMPVDIRAYGEANLEFPHESTMNQWFKESQFESYRGLGYFLASMMGKPQMRYASLAAFFADVSDAEIVARRV